MFYKGPGSAVENILIAGYTFYQNHFQNLLY